MMKTLALFALTPLGAVNLIIISLIASTALSIPLPEPNDSILVPRDVQSDTGTGTALYDRPMMQQIRSDDSSDFPLLFPRVKAEHDDDDDDKLSQYSAWSSSSVVKRPQSPDTHSPGAIKHELKTEDSETTFKLEELQKLEAEGRRLLDAKQVRKFIDLSRQFFKYYGNVEDNSGPERKWIPNPNSPLVQETAQRMRDSLWDLFGSQDQTTFIYIKRGMCSDVFFANSTNPWDPLKEPTLLPESIKSRLPRRPCAQELLDLGQELLDKHDTTNPNTNEGEHGATAPSDFLVGWQLKIMAGEWAADMGDKIPAKNILYLARDAEWATQEDSYERKVLHGLTGYLTSIARIKAISLTSESNWSPQKRRRDPPNTATGVSKRQKALKSRERARRGAGN